MAGKVSLIVFLRAKPGRRDDIIEMHDAEYMDLVQSEKGTEIWTMQTDPSDPDVLRVYELFSDIEALRAHAEQPIVVSYLTKVADLLAEPPEIHQLEPVNGLVKVQPQRTHVRDA